MLVEGHGYCDQHAAMRRKQDDSRRGTAVDRGYGYRWQKARITFLTRNPLCAECERRGIVTAASVVDHIVPHRGDQSLFWNTSNWQSLCKHCHDSIKQSAEQQGRGGKILPPFSP